MEALKNEVAELQSAFDLQEVLKRAVKYLIEGAALLAVAAFYILRKNECRRNFNDCRNCRRYIRTSRYVRPKLVGNAARQGIDGFGIGLLFMVGYIYV